MPCPNNVKKNHLQIEGAEDADDEEDGGSGGGLAGLPAPAAGDVSFVAPSVPIPRMTVVMMAVGTRGDVQPFVSLGKLLKANGHRVRLATHELYRPMVREAGLEFYPLGGDPMKLSAYMVKTSGRLFPKVGGWVDGLWVTD